MTGDRLIHGVPQELRMRRIMNNMAGVFKEIRDDDFTDDKHRKPMNECEKQLGGLLAIDFPCASAQQKEKKFFSFLKWFKKNKEASNWKNINALSSSTTSSPTLNRKENSSYDSLNTIFSTQTVRSFAYIPPLQYQPSAPTSSMLDIDKGEALSEFSAPLTDENGEAKNVKSVYDIKKKRKAPNPPPFPEFCFTRENSLPTTLERKCDETFHRRTVSESSKDRKAGAYCHVQGKRKAPLPPSKTPLYSNVHKLNLSHQSLDKKKKPAPPPPPPSRLESSDSKPENRSVTPSRSLASEKNEMSSSQIDNKLPSITSSSSPALSSRPWYKRTNNKHSSTKSFMKRDLLKSFEKRKKKEIQDWMPEVGYSRGGSLASSECGPGKFIMFAKADKSDEKKKEENRKSQISILTNISELDKEAAEILRKEQVEGKKMLAANDAKYFSNSNDFLRDEGRQSAEKSSAVTSHSVGDGSSSKVGNIASRYPPASPRSGGARVDHLATKSASPPATEVSPRNPTTDSNAGQIDKQNNGLRYFNEPWVCTKCTLENPGWRMFCEICGSVKSRFLFNVKESYDTPNSERKTEYKSRLMELQQGDENSTEANSENGSGRTRGKRATFHAPKSDVASTWKISGDNVTVPTTGADGEKTKKHWKEINNSLEVVKYVGREASEMKSGNGRRFEKPTHTAGDSDIDRIGDPEKCGAVRKDLARDSNTSNTDKPKVIEAYVVTQTTVLEDVVVTKKGSHGRRPSSLGERGEQNVRRKYEPVPVDERLKEVSSKFKEPLDLIWRPEAPPDVDENVQELTRIFSRDGGLEGLKATIRTMTPDAAVDEVLEKLAIRSGDQGTAAELARELARLNIKCSAPKAEKNTDPGFQKITIDMYVEDELSHRGPIRALVSPCMTLLQLKNKIQQELDIPVCAQRWILDKSLATDCRRTLESYGVKNNSCSVFLYLVSPAKYDPAAMSPQISDDERSEPSAIEERRRECMENFLDAGTDDESTGQTSKSQSSKDQHPRVKSSEREHMCAQIPRKLSTLKASQDNGVKTSSRIGSYVSANSVRQKVDQLNRAFEDNRRKSVNSSLNGECRTCTSANSAGGLPCLGCGPRKTPIGKSECREDGASAYATRAEFAAAATVSANIHYDELIRLQDTDIVISAESFHCSICLADYVAEEGITLKDCLHTFCRQCLVNTVQYSEDAEVKCPYMDETYSCKSVLQQREIKALVPQQVFDQHLAKSVKEAENKIENAFHCKTPDCKGWCVFEDNVNEFHCPVCAKDNCLTCHAIHTGMNCKQYQEQMKHASDTDADANKTRIMLQEMVSKGEAMACPKCQVILMKKWGCDWLRCSMCKTEICWVTRGFRWGPAGKGDTSSGCKCGVNGVKCHTKCNYCH